MSSGDVEAFTARGTMIAGAESVPVIISGHVPAAASESVRCTIDPEADLPKGFPGMDLVELTGIMPNGEAVWVPRFRITNFSASLRPRYHPTYHGTAELFMRGDLAEFDASGGLIVFSAQVPPVPIAQADHHFMPLPDGTVVHGSPEIIELLTRRAKGEPIEESIPIETVLRERRGIRWQTQFGEAELLDHYHNIYDQRVGLDKAFMRIQRYEVGITWQPNGVVSLKALLSNLPTELEDALDLISLISHRRIAWYDANAFFYWDGRKPGEQRYRATVRREQWLGYENDPPWTGLVRQAALKDDLLQQLLGIYRKSPIKHAIKQAIILLLSSYERGYMEARLGNLYAAIEGLVFALNEQEGRTFLLNNSDFSSLMAALEGTLEVWARDNLTGKEQGKVAGRIRRKLGELNRPPILERLLALLKPYKKDVKALLPPKANIETELRQLLTRRNEFIHQGRMYDDAYHRDFVLLQRLIELWVLKLLGCPSTALRFDNPPYM